MLKKFLKWPQNCILRYYHRLESDVEELPSSYRVGSILFETDELKLALVQECKAWKRCFGSALNDKAGTEQENIFNFIDSLSKRMKYDFFLESN